MLSAGHGLALGYICVVIGLALGWESRPEFDFLGSGVDFFKESTAGRGSGVEEGEASWLGTGVLGHVSDSTPLVRPLRSAGAGELTPGPNPT